MTSINILNQPSCPPQAVSPLVVCFILKILKRLNDSCITGSFPCHPRQHNCQSSTSRHSRRVLDVTTSHRGETEVFEAKGWGGPWSEGFYRDGGSCPFKIWACTHIPSTPRVRLQDLNVTEGLAAEFSGALLFRTETGWDVLLPALPPLALSLQTLSREGNQDASVYCSTDRTWLVADECWYW